MLVWILQTGEPLPGDSGDSRPMRAMNLASSLEKAGHEVVLWSARFDHRRKTMRSRASTTELSSFLTLKLIDSRGYEENVGLARLVDHFQLAQNLRTQMDGLRLPDVAFIGYPPIEPAYVMTKFLRANSVPVVLDVKDQWPHMFLDGLPAPLRLGARCALQPYFVMGRRTLRMSTAISSISEDFLEWCRTYAGSPIGPLSRVLPLTSASPQLTEGDRQAAETFWDHVGVPEQPDAMTAVFVGTFAERGFDFAPLLDAARNTRWRFVIAGSGPGLQTEISELAKLPNVVLPGWIGQAEIEILARRSHVALAPYAASENFATNVTNKIVDALRLGLPVLTSQVGPIGGWLVERHAGLLFGPTPLNSLTDVLLKLERDPDSLRRLSEGARSLYDKQFDYDQVYKSAVQMLEELAGVLPPSTTRHVIAD